jgi:putative Mn2+ efflux pump MntP
MGFLGNVWGKIKQYAGWIGFGILIIIGLFYYGPGFQQDRSDCLTACERDFPDAASHGRQECETICTSPQ